MPRKGTSGKWIVDVRPDGVRGKRVRKQFGSFAEANRFEAFIMGQAAQGMPWNPKPADGRKLSELIATWKQNHGQYLRDIDRREAVLLAITTALGDPIASRLKPEDFLAYRRSKPGIKDRPVSPKTLNNHLGYLRAVFNELERSGVVEFPNPLKQVRAIKLQERELSFLTLEQIGELLQVIERFNKNPHVLLLTKICLSTGCRWGEAEGLATDRVRGGKLSFTKTKSGKNRSVPISAELEASILAHAKVHGDGKRIFSSSMKAFDRVVKQLSYEIPLGQSTHVLRHTFASHFMMNGGDLLTLRAILGHTTIQMTMRYAHLAQDHLVQAVKLNPLAVN